MTPAAFSRGGERHFLYVAEPGIRNYVEYGGVGVLVYDMDAGLQVRQADSDLADVRRAGARERQGRRRQRRRPDGLYVTTIKRVRASTWSPRRCSGTARYEGGCDRLAISPDGATLYVPSFEGPHWNVVDAATGDVIAKIVTNSGAHNTIYVARRHAASTSPG